MELLVIAAVVGGYFWWKQSASKWPTGGTPVTWDPTKKDLLTESFVPGDAGGWNPSKSDIDAEIARAQAEGVKNHIRFFVRRADEPGVLLGKSGEVTAYSDVESIGVDASGQRVFEVRVTAVPEPAEGLVRPTNLKALVGTTVKLLDRHIVGIARSLK